VVTHNRTLTFSSTQRRELIDITSLVLGFATKSRVRNGLCVISAPHATAAIIVNENESGLRGDLLRKIEDLFPERDDYAHNAIDDNADAHVAASFLGHSKTFPIVEGRILRGTWQNILFVELDGPRSRRQVHVQVIGEE